MKNVLVYVVIFLAGCLTAYFMLPSKEIIKEVSSKEDRERISELQKKLSEKTKTIRLYNNGIVSKEVIYVDRQEDTQAKEKEKDKVVIDVKETEIINPKRYYVEVGYRTDKTYYFSSHYALFNPFHIGINFSSNFTNTTVFGLGLGFSF